jgi:hypothetical protein
VRRFLDRFVGVVTTFVVLAATLAGSSIGMKW